MIVKQTAKVIIWVGILTALLACSRNPDRILEDMMNADGMDEFNAYATEARELDSDSIPLFLTVLNTNLDDRYSVFSYGKIGVCLSNLHDLAINGSYSIEEVPVLLRAMREQPAIGDTAITAELLRLISKIDVGYDEQFIANYEPKDEPKRLEMISVWENWYNQQNSKDN